VVEVIQDLQVALDPQDLQDFPVIQVIRVLKASQDHPEVRVFQDLPDLLDHLAPQV